MLQIKTENGNTISVKKTEQGWFINDQMANVDMVRISENKFHLLLNHQSMMIELLGKDESGKFLDIAVDGHKSQVKVADQFDLLLAQLGMDRMASAKVNQIKAPMPGLVLRVMVKEGDEVKKGEGLLVLEAMKMENVIKAPEDVTIQKINVQEKTAVEKNQVLITLK